MGCRPENRQAHPAGNERHADGLDGPRRGPRTDREHTPDGDRGSNLEPGHGGDQAADREPVPGQVRGPVGPGLPRPGGVHRDRDRSDHRDDGSDADEEIGSEDEPESDERRTDRQPHHGGPGAGPDRDPRADDGREEVEQGGRHDQRHESDEIEPGMGRFDGAPRGNEWRPAADEEGGQDRSEPDLAERDHVALADEPAARTQAARERSDGGGAGQQDPDHERRTTRGRQGRLRRDNPGGGADRPDGNRRDRAEPQSCVARSRGGECGGEERHDPGNRGRGAAREGEVERQPAAASIGDGQEHRQHGRHQERDGDRDGDDGNESIRRAIDARRAPPE